ncbi:NADH dehydrogenase [ubiquinone] 1 alpha subcomplex subunit 8-like [Procambarus clarkii]|uniref:NADH dehydrogenase [ubiquinone] 1 alpha subcomplex subunit 8 n=1 Tax=Procambarus clarkii TaxID=6728 RepID=UPI001E67419E|nr:NADH dehydrogenase [ubiquinone] 1 alpha subcomplex subunit 8-like [Procambarus clarkii]
MFTKDFDLPTEEELTVEEINVSTPALKAAAFHLGSVCETQNNEFMLCRKEEKDPRKCINEGKDVTACSLAFFRKIKKTCLEEFNQYANCLDKSSQDLEYRRCRTTQAIFDKCVLDNLNVERPDFGYFCRPKIVDSKRPKPKPEEPIVFPDTPLDLPDDPPRGPARYGARFYWME